MKKFELKLRQRDIPELNLIADLRRVAKKVEAGSITKQIYDEHGLFGATTFIRRFGSWNRALEAARLGLNNRINIPNEELFENLANLWQRLGRQPVGKDISKSADASQFSLGTYEKRFGSWNKALMSFVEHMERPDETVTSEPLTTPSATGVRTARTPRKINWRLRATVLIRDSCRCRMCGASPAQDANVLLHVDHIRPWRKGGETVIENLQTLCSTCNIGKSDVEF